MPGWKNSTRKQTLPPNWATLRKSILTRDQERCTWDDHGDRCTRPATEVDHVIPGQDHTPQNLRSLCRIHHRAKSSSEGGTASSKRRAKRQRPTEQHPGIIKPKRRTQKRRSPGG